MGPFALVVFVACACLSLTEAQSTSPCSQVESTIGWLDLAWVPNTEDCRGFYMCFLGNTYERYCADGMVWQAENKVCCLKGSKMDTCTKPQTTTQEPNKFSGNDAQETCQPGMTVKLTHQRHCARYFDCSQTGIVRGLDEEHERECPHPELFNSETGQCEDQDQVECGERIKPKDACDYEMNKCHRSHCIPCWVRFPSCVGLGDGKRAWRKREGTPLYVECKNERVVKHGRCQNGYLFHPELLVCSPAHTVVSS